MLLTDVIQFYAVDQGSREEDILSWDIAIIVFIQRPFLLRSSFKERLAPLVDFAFQLDQYRTSAKGW